MKEIFKKQISTILIAIMVLGIILPACSNISVALFDPVLQSHHLKNLDGKTNVVKYSSIAMMNTDNIEIYTDPALVKDGRISIYGGTDMVVSDNTVINVKLHNSNVSNYRTILKVLDSTTGAIISDIYINGKQEKYENTLPITLNKSLIEQYKQQYGSNICLGMQVYKGDLNAAINEQLKKPIKIRFEESEDIEFTSANAGYYRGVSLINGFCCNDGFIANRKVYVKQGKKVYIQIASRTPGKYSGEKAEYRINGSGFNVGQDAKGLYIQATGKCGQSANLEVKFKGTVTETPLYISNLSTTEYSLKGTNITKQYLNGCNTNIVATKNSNKTITITVEQNPIKTQTADTCTSLGGTVKVEDVSSCTTGLKVDYYKDTQTLISFTPKSSGKIKVTFYDYLNNPYTEYWYISAVNKPTDSKEVVQTGGQETKVEVQVEAPKNTYTPTQQTPVIPSNQPGTSYQTPEPVEILNTPTINVEKVKETNDGSGVTLQIKTTNCTELKYKFIKRTNIDSLLGPNEVLNQYSSYNNFDGTLTTKTDSVTCSISSGPKGAGYYDLAVWGINKKADAAAILITYTSCFVDTAPQVNITPKAQQSTIDKKSFEIRAYDTDDKCETYYYIHRREDGKSYSRPQVDTIKGNKTIDSKDKQGKINASNIISVDYDKNYGGGRYDLTVYSVDTFGKETWAHVENIIVKKPVGFELTIDGEEKESVGTPRKEQTVNVTIKTEDKSDIIALDYVISKNYYEVREAAFSQPNEVKNAGKALKDGDTVSIKVTAEENEVEDYYIYLRAMDKFHVPNKLINTGLIHVDGQEFKLNTIKTNDKVEEGKVFGINKKFELKLQFTHYIDQNSCPDIYMDFGGVTAKQNSVQVDGNEATYTYIIKEEYGDGEIKIDHIDYSTGIFKEDTTNPRTYNKQVSEDTRIENLIDGKYTVDTTRPKVTSVTIDYQTKVGTNATKIIEDQNAVYISNLKDIIIKFEYDEEKLVGENPWVSLKIGDRWGTIITPGDITKSSYSIKHLFNGDIGGDILINGLPNLSVAKDLAGNSATADDYEVIYQIGGVDANKNKKIYIDNSVYEPEVYVGNTRVKEDSSYNTNTKFSMFEEFRSEESCEDVAGLDSIKMELYYVNEGVQVLDKSNNLVQPTNTRTAANLKEKFSHVNEYVLTQSQLPLSFTIENEGTYLVSAEKTDKLGNKAEKEVELNVKDLVKINKEESQLVDNNEKYLLVLELDSLDKDDIVVGVAKNEETVGKLDCIGTEEKNNKTYAKYKFDVEQKRKHQIKVYDVAEADISEYYNKDKKIYNSSEIVDYNILTDTVIAQTYRVGDVNGDGTVNGTDLTMILRDLVMIELLSGLSRRAADIDKDGEVGLYDAVLLSRALAGLYQLEL